jgi:hypothetical protein
MSSSPSIDVRPGEASEDDQEELHYPIVAAVSSLSLFSLAAVTASPVSKAADSRPLLETDTNPTCCLKCSDSTCNA